MLNKAPTLLYCFVLATWPIVVSLAACDAGEDEVLDYAFISNSGHGHLTSFGGKLKFHKGGPRGRSLWVISVREDGLRIEEKTTRKLLGIDPATKDLVLLDKSSRGTAWQAVSANEKIIKPGRTFDALIHMKVGDQDLRLSSDAEGKPVLGGKADILSFYIDGP